MNFKKYILLSGILISVFSCTNLDEELRDYTDNPDPDALLAQCYNGLREFQQQDRMFALNEVSTDIMIVPTRGGDWGDGGAWLQDHNHNWNADSREVNDSWKALLSSVYITDLGLAIKGIAPEKKAQVQFLKAYYYYNALDFFGQVPYRPAGSNPNDFPLVWDSPTATREIIALLEEALPNLPNKVADDPSIATKDAANFLLAKIYLNKAVFDSPSRIGFNPNNVSNMNKVIQYVDAISPNTTLANDYWDNFKPKNNTCPELIFTSKNINGVQMGEMRRRWYMGAHYNQTPGGWNGFSILSDFYGTFDPNDRRIKNNDSGIIATFGNPLGMQIGQQYKPGGLIPLTTRATNGSLPLVFDSANMPADGVIGNASDLERLGIRPQKYIPDASNYDKPDNDYVLMRYADALLMKAEAIARGGSGSLGIIQSQFTSRVGISTPTDLTSLAGIYKARGNELWLEGWRRNDMIRFGSYVITRPTMQNSDAYRVLFPIPTTALLNPNLKQNPGY
jgi:starch-binding outer membrane protein, SusD/RagB family